MKKNILLIGGSSGIGLATAKLLTESHEVYIASRSSDSLTGLEIYHLPFDVTTDDLSTLDLPAELSGLVYCPGSINLRPFKGLKPEAFEADFQINVMGFVKSLQAVLPKLTTNSSVVLYSTVAVKVGMPFHASVAASKGALEGLGKSLAAELAPKTRVNVIAPSITNTPLADRFLNNEAKMEKSAQRHPLKRVGEADDIAAMTRFLLSDESSWMTGQILGLDGGMSTLNTH
ncbi:MAG: SDR family oxidoreductase [Flavobacteriaceae bacterium]|nr:SDR family oxidoreductase [Flavobacteriaceae bacterium]